MVRPPLFHSPVHLLIALLSFMLTAPLIAQTPPEPDTSYRDQLEQEIESYRALRQDRAKELADIEAELGTTAASLQKRIAERDRVSQEIADLRKQRENLFESISELQQEQQRTEERIASLQNNLEALKGRIQSLMVNLYRQRTNRFALTLSQAKSFHELRVKNYYLSLLTKQDVALVNELNDTLAELQEAQETLTRQLEERRAKEAQLKVNEVELENARSKLGGIIEELQATREGQLAQKQALLREQNAIESSLTNLGEKYQAEIARLREEEEQLRRQAAQAFLDQRERQRLLQEADQARTRIENLTTPLRPLSSGFILPVSGAVLISDYGDNNSSFVALRADVPNAAVRSMQDGVVVQVALISANDGYLVAVQHSQDLVTAYTNLRRPLVAVGDRVAQGQVVGYLGGSSLLPNDVLKLWVRISRNGQTSYIDPGRLLGF